MKKIVFVITAFFFMTFLMTNTVQVLTVKAIWPYYYIYFYSPRPSSERIYQNTSLPITVEVGVWSYSPEIVSISYSLDGGSNKTLITYKLSDATYNASGTLTNLREGSHKLYVYAFAANREVVISEFETFEVNTLQPSPTTGITALPTPTVPELSWLAIVPLLFSMFLVAVVVRHRKTVDL